MYASSSVFSPSHLLASNFFLRAWQRLPCFGPPECLGPPEPPGDLRAAAPINNSFLMAIPIVIDIMVGQAAAATAAAAAIPVYARTIIGHNDIGYSYLDASIAPI